MTPPLISLEEHFYSQAAFDALDERGHKIFAAHPAFLKLLKDVEDDRLASMDSTGVATQIISHCWQTGGSTPEVCRSGNDELAGRIKAYPTRFAGFATLPIAEPQESAVELERAIKQLGFVGALIDNHVKGHYLEAPEYDALWRKAEELGVPVYIHPAFTSLEMIEKQYAGAYSASTAQSLACESWGWHSDTGLGFLRLFAAGVFDRFPRLKIIIGHFGEMLPFMLERVAGWADLRFDQRTRSIIEVWQNNVWITTSGVWSLNPMRCLLGNTPIEHILYSVDYPFTSNEQGRAWFQELEKSGLLSEEELEMVAYKNSQKLLKLEKTMQ